MSYTSGTTAIRPLLKRLGLDEKEIEIYLVLLPMKIAKATAIAKAARQSRSHTYLVLRSLKERGLVSELERGKIIHFVAESPSRLLGYIESREQELQQLKPLVKGLLPLLEGMTGPMVGTPRVSMINGLDGMKQLYRDMLGGEFSAFFNAEEMYNTFGENNMPMLLGKHTTFRGRDLLTNNNSAQRYKKEMLVYDQHKVRILPEHIQFNSDIIIFGDTIALFAYDAEETIIRIENQKLADTLLSIFEGLWSLSK